VQFHYYSPCRGDYWKDGEAPSEILIILFILVEESVLAQEKGRSHGQLCRMPTPLAWCGHGSIAPLGCVADIFSKKAKKILTFVGRHGMTDWSVTEGGLDER
jgi:hypothetical protein